MAAPETVLWGFAGATFVLRGAFGGDVLVGGELAGVAASASATGIAPKLVESTKLRAVRDFLIRDLQDFWSH
jgi:hypothetical protein